mgnify:CR=1 FL=1|jgi:hypothetical protein
MKYTNSWKANAKKNNKINFLLRIGKITFVKISFDIERKKYILTLLNFSINN